MVNDVSLNEVLALRSAQVSISTVGPSMVMLSSDVMPSS